MAPGDCSPGAPTDPNVRNSRIRLFGSWVRHTTADAVLHPRLSHIGAVSGVYRASRIAIR